MIEFVTNIAAIALLAAASIATASWAMAEKRKERSRVLVPVRARSKR